MRSVGVGGTLGAMRLVHRLPMRAPLDEADGDCDGETFGCSGLCDGPLPDSLLLADLSHRCVRLLEPTASAAASNSADLSTSSTSNSRESARLSRDWTHSSVYSAAAERDILAIATRTPHHLPPQLSASSKDEAFGDSGGGVGDAKVDEERELLVAERLRGKSPPAGWLVRAVWNSGAHRFEERARAALVALPPKYTSSLMTVAFAASCRFALVGLAYSSALDVFRLESPSRIASSFLAADTTPSNALSLVSAPPLALQFRQFCFAIGPLVSSPDSPQLLALICRDDHSIRVLLVRHFLYH